MSLWLFVLWIVILYRQDLSLGSPQPQFLVAHKPTSVDEESDTRITQWENAGHAIVGTWVQVPVVAESLTYMIQPIITLI